MNVNDQEAPRSTLHEALASFREILRKGDVQLTVTLHSNDGEPLAQIRRQCGGKN